MQKLELPTMTIQLTFDIPLNSVNFSLLSPILLLQVTNLIGQLLGNQPKMWTEMKFCLWCMSSTLVLGLRRERNYISNYSIIIVWPWWLQGKGLSQFISFGSIFFQYWLDMMEKPTCEAFDTNSISTFCLSLWILLLGGQMCDLAKKIGYSVLSQIRYLRLSPRDYMLLYLQYKEDFLLYSLQRYPQNIHDISLSSIDRLSSLSHLSQQISKIKKYIRYLKVWQICTYKNLEQTIYL